MELVTTLWRFAGFLGAAVVIVLLTYILWCLIDAIIKHIRRGGKTNGRS